MRSSTRSLHRPLQFTLLAAFFAFVVAALLSPQVFSQTQSAPPTSAKVAEITGEGSQKLNSAQIAAASGLKPGDQVGKEELQAAANRLAQLGVFGAVSYKYETKSDGVHVHFEVKDGSSAPVAYDNFPWFTDDELNAALKQSIPTYDGTAPTDGKLVDEMAKTLEKFLVSKGVYSAVNHSVVDEPDGSGAHLQFNVLNSPVELGKLDFTDPGAEITAQVAARLPDVVGHPYSRYSLGVFAIEQIRPAYLEAGHLKVTFGTPQATFTGTAPVGTQKSVTGTLPITPGPIYHLASLTWTGNSALSTAALNSLQKIEANGVADGMQLEATWVAVQHAYAHIGYLDAQVAAVATYDDAAGKVSYQVRITEGPQIKMGQLVITGLSLEAEKRLRAAWALQPGTVFDQAYFEDFRNKLAKPNPAIFGNLPVHYDKEGDLLRRNDAARTVDVLLDYQ